MLTTLHNSEKGQKKFSDLFRFLLPLDYRIKSTLITFSVRSISIMLALLLYYLITSLIPVSIDYAYQIGVIVTILVSIIALIPIQDIVELKLKKKFLSEFLFDDPVSLKNARRRFEQEALISNVFPDMVKMSGSQSGRLAILTPQSNYEIYTYEKGIRRKIKTKSIKINEKLISCLKSKKQGVSISEVLEHPEINNDFLHLKSNYILPFLFRDKVFGFLSLPKLPNDQEIPALNLLGSKAAIAVYNHILSSHLAIHNKYKREFETASKIENFIFTNKIPEFKHFEFKQLIKSNNILIEFFTNENEEYLFAFLVLNGNKTGMGLVSSHILGKLYSQSIAKKKHTIKSVKNIIEESLKELSWHDGYDLLIGNFYDQPNNSKLIFSIEGLNFKVVKETDPNISLISVGWRYTLELNKETLIINYKNAPQLSIRYI